MTSHLVYRKQLPRDLLDVFQRNDPEMIRHLLGDRAVDSAKEMNLTFKFLTGRWDMNTQMIDVAIQILGDDKMITWWLLKYQEK